MTGARRTSKLMTWTCLVGLFVVALTAVFRGLDAVAQTALVTLPVILGAYMGVGHADYRVSARAEINPTSQPQPYQPDLVSGTAAPSTDGGSVGFGFVEFQQGDAQ